MFSDEGNTSLAAPLSTPLHRAQTNSNTKTKCMQQLILKSQPQYPPYASGPHDTLFGEPFQKPTDAFPLPKGIYSHGGGLTMISPQDYLHLILLQLVFRCLADLPEQRPSLEELAVWLDIFEANVDRRQPDDWFRTVFDNPVPVRNFLSFFCVTNLLHQPLAGILLCVELI